MTDPTKPLIPEIMDLMPCTYEGFSAWAGQVQTTRMGEPRFAAVTQAVGLDDLDLDPIDEVLVYPGGAYIVREPDAGPYAVLLDGNYHTGDLATLEAALWAWTLIEIEGEHATKVTEAALDAIMQAAKGVIPPDPAVTFAEGVVMYLREM